MSIQVNNTVRFLALRNWDGKKTIEEGRVTRIIDCFGEKLFCISSNGSMYGRLKSEIELPNTTEPSQAFREEWDKIFNAADKAGIKTISGLEFWLKKNYYPVMRRR